MSKDGVHLSHDLVVLLLSCSGQHGNRMLFFPNFRVGNWNSEACALLCPRNPTPQSQCFPVSYPSTHDSTLLPSHSTFTTPGLGVHCRRRFLTSERCELAASVGLLLTMAFALPTFPLQRRPGPSHLARVTAKRPRTFCARPATIRAQTGYIPADDDKAEPVSNVPNQLTLPQQLLLKQYEEQVDRMSQEECRKLAIEIARQMMVKDNILRKMLKTDADFGVEPPDPDDFQTPEKKL